MVKRVIEAQVLGDLSAGIGYSFLKYLAFFLYFGLEYSVKRLCCRSKG